MASLLICCIYLLITACVALAPGKAATTKKASVKHLHDAEVATSSHPEEVSPFEEVELIESKNEISQDSVETNNNDINVNVTTTVQPLSRRWADGLITSHDSFSFYLSALGLHVMYFLQAFLGPVLSMFLRILYRLAVQPLVSYLESSLPNILPPDASSARYKQYKTTGSSTNSADIVNDDESFTASQRKTVIKTAKEDQKALKGDRRDVDRLKQFGYKKYRYVSNEFLQRNGLQQITFDEGDETPRKDESVRSGQRAKKPYSKPKATSIF